MKRFSIILLAFSPVLMSACAANSNINWIIPESERLNYPAVPTDSIVMFRQDRGDSIPQNHVPLALIYVRTGGFGNLTGTLRTEAGKLGANAIIIVEDIRVGVGEEPPPPKREPTCEDVVEVENDLGGMGGNTDGAGIVALVAVGCVVADLALIGRDVVEADFSDGSGYRAMRAILVYIPPGG